LGCSSSWLTSSWTVFQMSASTQASTMAPKLLEWAEHNGFQPRACSAALLSPVCRGQIIDVWKFLLERVVPLVRAVFWMSIPQVICVFTQSLDKRWKVEGRRSKSGVYPLELRRPTIMTLISKITISSYIDMRSSHLLGRRRRNQAEPECETVARDCWNGGDTSL
jgi:hypothetical protein